MSRRPLEGLLVLEMTTGVAGAYCGKLLGDLGADVLKIEPPEGDPLRAVPPFPSNGVERGGALFLYLSAGKRSRVLDPSNGDDFAALDGLLERANAVIDDSLGGNLGAWELPDASSRYPGLVHASVTPYGLSGPGAGCRGGELSLNHAGGLGNLLPSRSRDVDRAPVKLGGRMVGYHGGLVTALATLARVLDQEDGGPGGRVEVSLQEVLLSMVSPLVVSRRYHRSSWSRVPDRPPAMGRMAVRDGFVILNAFDDHHFEAFRKLMGDPPWCAGDEWRSMAYRVEHLMEIAGRIDEWMLGRTRAEIHRAAGERGIPIGPIDDVADVLANEQYAYRGFFVEVDVGLPLRLRQPGWPYRLSATPAAVVGPAPRLGEEPAAPLPGSARPMPRREAKLPLAGIRVVELCWVWAGPYAGSLLAALGAEVIKIEGPRRTDLTRRGVIWPRSDPTPTRVPPNQGMAFNQVNLGKRSLTVDLTDPRGVEIVKSLVRSSDVVIDNMRSGALAKLGLGWEDLHRLKDDLIVASSSGRGAGGPFGDFLGYAMIHQGIGGGAFVTGYPDEPPCHSGGDVDLMNAVTFAFSIVAALRHRRRAGEGQVIDYSQCEGVTSLLGELFLGYQLTGEIPQRRGNRDPRAAPHSVYRAWGVDRWLAIEVHDDSEFAALAEVMGVPELGRDPRFADAAARKRHEDELDAIIEAWTRERDRDRLVGRLVEAGVTAAPSRDADDLWADPHLAARRAFVTVEHPELGELELVGAPWLYDGERPATRSAPLLGADNRFILRELLGFDDSEIEALDTARVTA